MKARLVNEDSKNILRGKSGKDTYTIMDMINC